MPLYVEPGGGQAWGALQDVLRRLLLPYGIWSCAGGREVLFNRRYKPLWQRTPDSAGWEPAQRGEWVEGIAEQRWFYREADVVDGTAVGKAQAALDERGLPRPDRASLTRTAGEEPLAAIVMPPTYVGVSTPLLG